MEANKFEALDPKKQEELVKNLDRKEELGFYAQFYNTQHKVTLLAFQSLKKEVENEIILFSKNFFKPNDVIKFDENFKRSQFYIVSKYFEGRKYRDFLNYYTELTENKHDEFWQSIANNEKISIHEHMDEIFSRASLCGRRIDTLKNKPISSKILSKILNYDAVSLQDEVLELSHIYEGLSELYKTWIGMTEFEQEQYVAKRYLSTGLLSFDSETVDKYCLESSKKVDELSIDEGELEMPQ